jgi:hypothetical protein
MKETGNSAQVDLYFYQKNGLRQKPIDDLGHGRDYRLIAYSCCDGLKPECNPPRKSLLFSDAFQEAGKTVSMDSRSTR